MRPSVDAPPWKRLWKPAMEEIEDDIDFAGIEYYELPTGDVIYSGDRYWHAEERYVIEIETVKTKLLADTRGKPRGDDAGTDYVFFDRDWEPPYDPRIATSGTNEFYCTRAAEFAQQVATGVLVAHRGNGRPPRPP